MQLILRKSKYFVKIGYFFKKYGIIKIINVTGTKNYLYKAEHKWNLE